MLGNAPIRIEHPRAASGTVGALGLTNTSGAQHQEIYRPTHRKFSSGGQTCALADCLKGALIRFPL